MMHLTCLCVCRTFCCCLYYVDLSVFSTHLIDVHMLMLYPVRKSAAVYVYGHLYIQCIYIYIQFFIAACHVCFLGLSRLSAECRLQEMEDMLTKSTEMLDFWGGGMLER